MVARPSKKPVEPLSIMHAVTATLAEQIADAHYRDFIKRRRAARIALAREWAVAGGVIICAIYALRHW